MVVDHWPMTVDSSAVLMLGKRKLQEILLTLPSMVWLVAFFVVPALIVFALAISIIYGWLIRRLRSAAVKSEFSRGRALRLGTQAHNG